jgi:hypothetical protein
LFNFDFFDPTRMDWDWADWGERYSCEQLEAFLLAIFISIYEEHRGDKNERSEF